MSKGRYVVPVVMGQLGSELFLVKGEVPRSVGMALVRLDSERGLTVKDEKALVKLYEKIGHPTVKHIRLKEASLINQINVNAISEVEATLVTGYINNTLPGAFRAPELSNWFIYERQGDLIPLKLARFTINLLEHSERKELISHISAKAAASYNTRYENYR